MDRINFLDISDAPYGACPAGRDRVRARGFYLYWVRGMTQYSKKDSVFFIYGVLLGFMGVFVEYCYGL